MANRLLLELLAFTSMAMGAANAQTASVRVATWNLGWHVSVDEVPDWIEKCNRSYVKNTEDDWKLAPPSADPKAIKAGWFVPGSRVTLEGLDIAKTPPCGVYKTRNSATVAFKKEDYEARLRQLSSFLNNSVKPDVIAFQEVSGTKAVKEALAGMADEYEVCSFDGEHKVQRLAFAWRKSIVAAVEPCRLIKAMSLPGLPEKDQVRPGLQVDLRIAGKQVRFLTVHLKSSCVSPLDGGQLDVPEANRGACGILQQQIKPLEDAIEALASNGVDHFIVLGDFNRNLWHEHNKVPGAEPYRSGKLVDLTTPLPEKTASRNLLREVNDLSPPESELNLLHQKCPGEVAGILCRDAHERNLTWDEQDLLSGPEYLGCRWSTGLDHLLVSNALVRKVSAVEKLSIGRYGGSRTAVEAKAADGEKPAVKAMPALLSISDHCPSVLSLRLN